MAVTKIGDTDITVGAIVSGTIALVLALVAAGMYVSGSAARELGGGAQALQEGMQSRDAGKIAQGADAILRVQPRRFEVALMKASALVEAGKIKRARKTYKSILSNKRAKNEHKAVAQVALGVLEVRTAKADKKRDAALSAKDRFTTAIALDDEFGDAYANLATVHLILDEPDEAGQLFQQALAAAKPPTRQVLANVYNGLGIVRAGMKAMAEATANFSRAKFLFLGGGKWEAPELNLKAASLSLIARPDADAQERKRILKMIEKERWTSKQWLQKFSKDGQFDILVRIALGYYYEGNKAKMNGHFSQALDLKTGRPDVYVYRVSLSWPELEAYLQAAVEAAREAVRRDRRGRPQKTGNPWLDERPKLRTVRRTGVRRRPRTREYSQAERTAKEWFQHVANALEVKELPPDVRWKLQRASAEVHLLLAQSNAEDAQKNLAEAAALLRQCAESKPEDAETWRRLGTVSYHAARHFREKAARMSEKEEEKIGPLVAAANVLRLKANDALRKSLEFNPAQEDLKLLLGLRKKEKVRIAEFRPAGGVARSTTPLLSATILGIRAEDLSRANPTMTLDGRQVTAQVAGNEILYFTTRELGDGKHQIVVTCSPPGDVPVTQSYTFAVDNAAPEITSFQPPEGGSVSGRRPLLRVTYRDSGSGIDPRSVEVTMRPIGGSALFRDLLVSAGRYTFAHRRDPEIKKGVLVGDKELILTSKRSLSPGKYRLTIRFADNRGISAERVWTFAVTE